MAQGGRREEEDRVGAPDPLVRAGALPAGQGPPHRIRGRRRRPRAERRHRRLHPGVPDERPRGEPRAGTEAMTKDPASRPDAGDLDDRAGEILKSVIQAHVLTGEPVGSRTLSRGTGLDLSPATIRNVMSDLEERGLLSQPHASAGRVPTDLAYRLYVDRLMSRPPIEAGQRARDRRGAPAPPRRDPGASRRGRAPALARLAARRASCSFRTCGGSWSSTSSSSGSTRSASWRSWSTARASSTTASSTSRPRSSSPTSTASGNELSRSVSPARRSRRSARRIARELLGRAVRLRSPPRAPARARPGRLGGRRGCDGRVRRRGLEPRRRAWSSTTSSGPGSCCARSSRRGGWSTCSRTCSRGKASRSSSAARTPSRPSRTCSVVASTYRAGDRVLGTVGIVGPTRMEYARAIALVDYLAHVLTRFLTNPGG